MSKIVLEPKHEELLLTLAEAALGLKETHEPFLYVEFKDGGSLLVHPGLNPVSKKRVPKVNRSDLETLADKGLLLLSYSLEPYISLFEVTGLGFRHYEDLKQRANNHNGKTV